MDDLLAAVAAQKAELDRLRPLRSEALSRLRGYYDVELTYTSNAVEGNSLTFRETAEVIEHGITVGGKPLRDHLEAVDHHAALGWMRELADRTVAVGEAVICEMHRRIVARSQPAIAGIYSTFPRRVAGSAAVFPNPRRIPALMEDLGRWLEDANPGPETAFEAHARLTAIHPFADGNGRTARLLMNLLLLRAGYPPVSVRPADRRVYLEALEHDSLTGDRLPFRRLLYERLAATLDDYVAALREALPGEGEGS